MSSTRLPKDFENRLSDRARMEKTTKSEIIRRALSQYFVSCDQLASPFELGKDLFGTHGSGRGDLSRNYKKIIKGRLREKHARSTKSTDQGRAFLSRTSSHPI